MLNTASRIMIIDDDDLNLDMLARKLSKEGHQIHKAISGVQGLALVATKNIDLIICDMEMPEMNGFDVLSAIKADPRQKHIPVVMLSANDDMDAIGICISHGADDYLIKPCNSVLLRARVNSCLTKKRLYDQERKYQNQLREANTYLETRVQEQVNTITAANLCTIFAMSKLAESKDPDTGAHLERLREYCRILAIHLSKHPKYTAVIDSEFIETIYASSPLHDIGKVGIPDHILLKPGKLTADEWKIMRQHTQIGAEALRQVVRKHPGNMLLHMGIEIAECHHEKWDGSGYPYGLKQEHIPLAARLIALADVYDALTSERCYKTAFSHTESKKIIVDGSGTHFDPTVVAAFLATESAFMRIRTEIIDGPAATLLKARA